ncbi:unnamed protein product [Amoebophrya sp. A25]|nr:unnamed protein product [Amoebophrya sp. A25]|eukprot:GSA25T00026978001.1
MLKQKQEQQKYTISNYIKCKDFYRQGYITLVALNYSHQSSRPFIILFLERAG